MNDDFAGRSIIRVYGRGQASTTPNHVKLVIEVDAKDEAASAALATAARASTAVTSALRQHGVAEQDAATRGLMVAPVAPMYGFDDETGQRVSIGPLERFEVKQVIVAQIRDLASAAMVLDAVVAAGASSVRLEYPHTVPADVRAAARSRAVDDARRSAEQYASSCGMRLGLPLRVSESERPVWHGPVQPNTVTFGPGMPPPPPRYGMEVGLSEVEYEIDIEIVYSLEPA